MTKKQNQDLIDLCDKLASLETKGEDHPKDTFASRDFAMVWDIGRSAASRKLARLVDKGEVEYVGIYNRMSITGNIVPTPHYRVLVSKTDAVAKP